MTQNTYEYEGVKLLKKATKSSYDTCVGCFFEHNINGCTSFVPKIADCFEGQDDNKTEMIFVEANEPVNKID